MTNSLPLVIGDKLQLTCPVWDDGEDHHPPTHLAATDDIVVVRGFRGQSIIVRHTRSAEEFLIWRGEFVKID